MKENKPDRIYDANPSKRRPEHPDNDIKGLKEQGPSSGAWKHNPHRYQNLVQHARALG